jgi:hypothetical protein
MPILLLLLVVLGGLAAAPADGQDYGWNEPPDRVSGFGGPGDQTPAVELLPPSGPQGPVVLDAPYIEGPYGSGGGYPAPQAAFDDLWAPRPWYWQLLPNNLIYTSYLAGPKEPRFATVWYDDTDPDPLDPSVANGWLWDSTLGGPSAGLRGATRRSRLRTARSRR